MLSILLAALLAASAACMLVFVSFRDDGALSAAPDKNALLVVVTGAVFVVVLLLSLATFTLAPRVHARVIRRHPLRRLRLDWRASSVLVAWLIVVLLWSPWVFLQFPTGMSNDTFEQLYEFQTSAPTYYYALGVMVPESFVDHHPLFDTLLYGAFFMAGDSLGSQNWGVFAFALLQALLTALVLAASVCYLDELGVSKPARLFALAFVALFPFIPAYAMTMVKDPTFCVPWVLFWLMYLRAWQTRGQSLSSVGAVLGFFAVVCLCILTKKTGVIVCAVSVAVLVFWCRGHLAFLRIACPSIVALAMCFAVLPALVYPAVGGVAPGGRQEALGILYQQVVTAQREHGDLTGGERAAMEGVMDFDAACEKWSASTVDPVKARAHYEISDRQYEAFARAYLAIGLRHPDSYAASVLRVAIPLLAPGTGMGYYGTPRQEDWRVRSFYEHTEGGAMRFDVVKPAQVTAFSSPAQKAVYAVFDSIPGSILLGVGMFGGWLPAFCMLLSLRGGRRYAVAFVPLAVSVLLLFVCPAAPTRYILPMLYTVPLMFGLLSEALSGGKPALRSPSCPERRFG